MNFMKLNCQGSILIAALPLILMFGCGGEKAGDGASSGAKLEGTVRIDGSSTVFPISEAVAEEFLAVQPGVRVAVGMSGTGGGFKKFALGEIDISDASRPIKESEAAACAEHGIEFIELPVAFDGLSVLVNPSNKFVDYLTVAELKKIWEPGSKVGNWSQVRDGFPDLEIKLYGPGTDSGTFDYFTHAINGEEGSCRPDFTASEDDNVLVTGIQGDAGSLGFFGYAYYAANKDRLKLVAVGEKDSAVLPSEKTINDGTYQPLSRPIFIYVSTKSAARPEVKEFVHFYLANCPKLVSEVGYVSLGADNYRLVQARFDSMRTGSAFSGGSKIGVELADVIR